MASGERAEKFWAAAQRGQRGQAPAKHARSQFPLILIEIFGKCG